MSRSRQNPAGMTTASARRLDVAWTLMTALVLCALSSPLTLGVSFPGYLAFSAVSIGVLTAVDPRRSTLTIRRVPLTVVGFLAFSTASAFWSEDAADTTRAVVVSATVAACAVVVGQIASRRALGRAFAWATLIVVASTVWAIATGRTGAIATSPGGPTPWAGLYLNRNALSYVVVFLLVGVLALRGGRSTASSLVRGAAAISGLVVVYLSRSASGLAVAGLLVALMTFLAWLRGRSPQTRRAVWRAAPAVLIGTVAVAVGFWSSLTAWLGRDASLSGRVSIWEAAARVSEQSRWGGFGWGAVWDYRWAPSDGSTAHEAITAQTGTRFAHGHNALFDLVPQVGIVGTALAIAVLVLTVVHALRAAQGSLDQSARFGILAVAAIVALGVTEPTVAIPLGWFVIVLAATVVEPPRPPAGLAPRHTVARRAARQGRARRAARA